MWLLLELVLGLLLTYLVSFGEFICFTSLIVSPILFGISGAAYFIWEGGRQKCPTLVCPKLEMV